MKQIIILMLMAACSSAFAIEGLDCEYALTGSHEVSLVPGWPLTLAKGQVLIRGRLAGNMALAGTQRTNYSVRDDLKDQRVFADARDAMHVLTPGDRIYFLDLKKPNTIAWAGTYDEVIKKVDTRDRFGRPLTLYPNRPVLRELTPDRSTPLAPDQIDELFRARMPVIVVKSLDESAFTKLRERIAPTLVKFREHQQDLSRFVEIEPNRIFERAHFECVLRGPMTYSVDKRNYGYKGENDKWVVVSSDYPVPVHFRCGDKSYDVTGGDLVYFLDQNGKVLMEKLVIEDTIVVREPTEGEDREFLEMIGDAKRVVVIRRK